MKTIEVTLPIHMSLLETDWQMLEQDEQLTQFVHDVLLEYIEAKQTEKLKHDIANNEKIATLSAELIACNENL